MTSKHFLVRRDRLAESKVVTVERAVLPPGAVELEIERFGLTANNVTYGVLGESFSYWQFFPDAEEGWGKIPVWGFAKVTRSEYDGVSVGDRFYGYYPMSTHVIVHPRREDEVGFLDGAPHRRSLSNVYNHYRRTSRDPSYRPDTEPQQVILRPLFATSFLIADLLHEERFFGADSVVFSSASSKTAYGTAFLLSRRGERKVVGLTSRRHLDFVTRLGVYDRVVPYEEIASLPKGPTAYVDFSGSHLVRTDVHRHFAEALQYSCAVGATHWQSLGRNAELPGPKPATFFAPARMKQRATEWTPSVLQQRLADAWNAFLVPVLDPSRGWLSIEHHRGDEEVKRAYDELLQGQSQPDRGHVLSLT